MALFDMQKVKSHYMGLAQNPKVERKTRIAANMLALLRAFKAHCRLYIPSRRMDDEINAAHR